MISKTENLSLTDEHYEDLPEAWECIAHLKLLTAFTNLREDISRTQKLFPEEIQTPNLSVKQRKQTVEEKRWTIFVARAVKRFERWFQTQIVKHNERKTHTITTRICTSQGSLQRIMKEIEPSIWSADNLPPLDILMVFHTYMLNPRWFLDDCLRLRLVSLWKAGMPWSLISKSIDDRTFVFTCSETAQQTFSRGTGLHWDNLEDAESDLFSCSICESLGSPLLSNGNEWMDHEDFTLLCSLPCRDLEHLRRSQLAQISGDIHELQKNKLPLRATILNENGLAISQPSLRPESLFPSRLFSLVDLDHGWKLRGTEQSDKPLYSIANLFTDIKNSCQKKSSKLRAAKSNPFSSSFKEAEMYSFNRALLAYSEGPSIFSLDLTAAVLRQGKFIQQMHELDWIHSPGLANIMECLIDKYEVFMDIMRLSKKEENSVPTLAVDLAWHTQQLSPEKYYKYCISNVNGVFIDHDDRIGEGDLVTAFARTSEMFQKLTEGDDYSQCLCWHCAALNERALQAQSFQKDDKTDVEQLKILADVDVRKAQAQRFADDYNRHKRGKDTADWEVFAKEYKWPYPDFVPQKEELASQIETA